MPRYGVDRASLQQVARLRYGRGRHELYRDAIVLESWEGTHNVLCLQALRDMMRYGLHRPFLDHLAAIGAELRPRLPALSDELLAAIEHARELAARLVEAEPRRAQAHAPPPGRYADRRGAGRVPAA